MVVVTSRSPQPNEFEQKKKRQTLERAKATHLSKQLQMRLQYAKLKVEHGWQRQNLNEVENLYFHHSHLRQRSHFAPVSHPPPPSIPSLPTETYVSSPALPGALGQTTGPPPTVNDASSDPVSQSPPEHSQPHLSPTLKPTPPPVAPSSTSSSFDVSDPNVLARLAQLQAQVQATSQPQSRSVSRQPSTIIPQTTTASQSASGPNPFPPLSQPAMTHPQSDFVFPLYASQPPGSTPHHPAVPLQPAAVPTSASASTAPMPTPPISTPTSIAPTALTYDSFWSTHASSTGPTRALYRTHTGFTASATSTGNVAMLTPGGHAAVMTAEGVYVGGSRSG